MQPLHPGGPVRRRLLCAVARDAQAPSELLTTISKALVFVTFRAPFGIEGLKSKSSSGVGVIVSKDLGIAVVDRATVPIMLGTVTITIAGSVTIPANTVFLHPYQVPDGVRLLRVGLLLPRGSARAADDASCRLCACVVPLAVASCAPAELWSDSVRSLIHQRQADRGS